MIKRKYPNLCRPLEIGDVTIKNRMVSAPMAFPDITPEGHVTQRAAAFYALRARGGAAFVTLSECIVHIKTGMSHSRHINLEDEHVLGGLTEAARMMQGHGALANIELSHGGMYAGVDRMGKGESGLRYGPSPQTLSNGARVEEMHKPMIHEIVESFGKGAALAKRAGFDMVLIHGGHGWLIHQFFSPAVNRRGDEYGGQTLANRARFALEVLESVRAAVGKGFPIEFRMSAQDYMPGGHGLKDAIAFAKLLENEVDLLQVSTGSHESSFSKTHPSMFDDRGINVHLAEAVKANVKIPVACIGALNDPSQMEDIVASGKADVVEMARALLADPFLPRKVMLGRDDEIVNCTRCFTCLAERVHTQTRICSVNPVIGREYENLFALPPSRPKKVLVAGGGPGGMQTAITAAQRRHTVVLCEKSGVLGGALNFAKAISFKQDLYALINSLAGQLDKAGVEVRLNTEVTGEFVDTLSPDVLVLAVGATPIIPAIPGMDNEKMILAGELSYPDLIVGDRVVIIGGGLVGCEAAVFLAQQGKAVTIIEMQDDIAVDANVRQKPILLEMLRQQNVQVETGMKGLAVDGDGLACEDTAGRKVLFETDSIVCAVGQRPLREVVNGLLDAATEVVQVGDCVKPQSVTQALHRGYQAGLNI
ncbi:MAG: FAD-dependent oxidoreductase [Desulfobacterium sp.]